MAGVPPSIETVLEQTGRHEPMLRAYAFLDPALVTAQSAKVPDGPLAGHAVAVKDVFDTADMPTGYGCAAYAAHRPARDAAAVAALRKAGAVILGKTVTTEFAFTQPGPTTNPFNPAHTPGGSSSGSAAAVGSGAIDMATGTQTTGSIMRPAAYCGVVGYKPGFGAVSRAGVAQLGESLDVMGGFGRTVAHAARLVGVMAGRPDLMDASPICGPRLGVYLTPDAARACDAAHDTLERVLRLAARHGAQVTRISEGALDWAACIDAHKTIMKWEVPRAMAPELQSTPTILGDDLRQFCADPPEPAAYLAARRRAAEGQAALSALAADFDAIVTFGATGPAPEGLAFTGDPHFNRVWSLLRGPALHLPVDLCAKGLPLGIQLVGAPGREGALLATAAALEAMLDWELPNRAGE